MTLSGWVLSGPISSVTWFITEVSSRLPAKSLATTFDDSTGNPFATAKRRSISVVCAPVSTIAEVGTAPFAEGQATRASTSHNGSVRPPFSAIGLSLRNKRMTPSLGAGVAVTSSIGAATGGCTAQASTLEARSGPAQRTVWRSILRAA